jgi:hypothetical protein
MSKVTTTTSNTAIKLNTTTSTTIKPNLTLLTATTSTTSADELFTEWIVFALSMASFALILFYVLYELLYPLIFRSWIKERQKEDYYRRYNREAYEEVARRRKKEETGDRVSLLEGKKKSEGAPGSPRTRQSNGVKGSAYMMVPE